MKMICPHCKGEEGFRGRWINIQPVYGDVVLNDEGKPEVDTSTASTEEGEEDMEGIIYLCNDCGEEVGIEEIEVVEE